MIDPDGKTCALGRIVYSVSTMLKSVYWFLSHVCPHQRLLDKMCRTCCLIPFYSRPTPYRAGDSLLLQLFSALSNNSKHRSFHHSERNPRVALKWRWASEVVRPPGDHAEFTYSSVKDDRQPYPTRLDLSPPKISSWKGLATICLSTATARSKQV